MNWRPWHWLALAQPGSERQGSEKWNLQVDVERCRCTLCWRICFGILEYLKLWSFWKLNFWLEDTPRSSYFLGCCGGDCAEGEGANESIPFPGDKLCSNLEGGWQLQPGKFTTREKADFNEIDDVFFNVFHIHGCVPSCSSTFSVTPYLVAASHVFFPITCGLSMIPPLILFTCIRIKASLSKQMSFLHWKDLDNREMWQGKATYEWPPIQSCLLPLAMTGHSYFKCLHPRLLPPMDFWFLCETTWPSILQNTFQLIAKYRSKIQVLEMQTLGAKWRHEFWSLAQSRMLRCGWEDFFGRIQEVEWKKRLEYMGQPCEIRHTSAERLGFLALEYLLKSLRFHLLRTNSVPPQQSLFAG